jgi:hypothetical protein
MRHRYRLFAEDPDWEDGSTARGKASLTTVLKLILGAAIITAPLYVIGETFDLSHAGRVLLINGGTTAAAVILLLLAQHGYGRLVSVLTAWDLYALVTWLAATSKRAYSCQRRDSTAPREMSMTRREDEGVIDVRNVLIDL